LSLVPAGTRREGGAFTTNRAAENSSQFAETLTRHVVHFAVEDEPEKRILTEHPLRK
jgi:hypothetical protein